MADMDVTVDEGVAVLHLRSDLDLRTAPRLIGRVHELARSGVRRVEVDCEDVDFLDSGGLRALLVSLDEAGKAGVGFAVTSPSRAVHRVLDMTGLSPLLLT